jgi:hypothetical protein
MWQGFCVLHFGLGLLQVRSSQMRNYDVSTVGLGGVSGTLLGLNVVKHASKENCYFPWVDAYMCNSNTELESQRDGVKDQLKHIKGQQDAIDLLLTDVHSVNNESQKVTQALGVFQNVWQGVTDY